MVQSASPLNSPSLKFRSGLRYFYLYIFYSGGAILNRAPRSGLSSCPSRKPSAQAVSNCSIFTLSFFFFQIRLISFFSQGVAVRNISFAIKFLPVSVLPVFLLSLSFLSQVEIVRNTMKLLLQLSFLLRPLLPWRKSNILLLFLESGLSPPASISSGLMKEVDALKCLGYGILFLIFVSFYRSRLVSTFFRHVCGSLEGRCNGQKNKF